MSRAERERLERTARRTLDQIGRASGLSYVAERQDILGAAKGWLEENGYEDPDIMDILSTAEFLAGDRVNGDS